MTHDHDTEVAGGKLVTLATRRQRRPSISSKNTEASWLDGAQRDDRGQPIPNLYNAMLALRRAPELVGAIGLDQMLDAPVVLRPLPRVARAELVVATAPRPLRDTDVSEVQEWMQAQGMPRLSREAAHQAIAQSAASNAFHPVHDYLNSLGWDGRPRVNGWLSKYLGVESTAYTAGIGAMFLTALVARIFDPGCKSDYLLVLEGPQGVRKSTACAILGGAWFSDCLPDITSGKDVSQHLNGKWLIELSELSALKQAESAALKAFISRPVERYRPSYGRLEVIKPRMCLFVGTTNKAAYLKDETGGRRFWPVKVGAIDTDALQRDRDQLFAEAVIRYRNGGTWWPNAVFEREHITPEQEARFEVDVWAESITDYIDGRPSVLIKDIAHIGLSIPTGEVGRAQQNRIVAVLERLGWRRLPKDRRGNIAWGPS